MGFLKTMEDRMLSAYDEEDLFTRKKAALLLRLNLVILLTSGLIAVPAHVALFQTRPFLAPGDILFSLGMLASMGLIAQGRLGLAGTISIVASLLTPFVHNVLGDLWRPEQAFAARYYETLIFVGFIFPVTTSFAIKWHQILTSALLSCGVIIAHFFALRYGCAVHLPGDSLLYLTLVVIAGTFGILNIQVTDASLRSLKKSKNKIAAWNKNLKQIIEVRTHELQTLNQALEAMSITDGLTGIANRRKFDATYEAEWNRASRMGTPLAVLLLDLDQFKLYNDGLGHQEGDRCIQAAAQKLDDCLHRAGELVARYGGEEFAVLLPGANTDEALAQAERLRKGIEALALPHVPSAAQAFMTVSVGIAARPIAPGDTMDTYLREADGALYSAKGQGRNRCVLATSTS